MNLKGKSLLVLGSRTLDDGRIEEALATFVEQNNFKIIVTALDQKGVCDRVNRYAKKCQNGITLIQIGLNKGMAGGMHEHRSIKALELADHMLAFWDGKSKGTKNEIEMAEKLGVPTTVVKLDNEFDLINLDIAFEDEDF